MFRAPLQKLLLLSAIFFSAPRESFWTDVSRLEDDNEIAAIKSVPAHYAGAFTEFYTNASTGNQMNGGSDSGSPSYTPTNGGWVSGTGVYTPTSGNPSLSVTVGQFAAVFTDGGTTPGFVGRVTAASSTTVTVSTTAKTGTIPTTAGSGISMRVGGAWLGPNGASAWPVGSLNNVMTNAAANPPRCNMKTNATYAITAGVTQNQSSVMYQGYASTVGDGGRATIDGSTNAIVLWTASSALSSVADVIFSNNGTTGVNAGIIVSGGGAPFYRCVFHDFRGAGASISSLGTYFEECEFYSCNSANTANIGSATTSAAAVATFNRCCFHDNSGSNAHGIVFGGSGGGGALLVSNCIFDTNGGSGLKSTSTGSAVCINSDFYNNSGSGIDVSTNNSGSGVAQNCNFIKNTSNGVTGAAAGIIATIVSNCGFGSGTMANAATTSGRTVIETNSVTYASGVTPWVDPANGDFRINLAAAIGTGRGAFTQTQASYTGASGSPVIGACQVADYPAIANVNSGTNYANGAYTGTLSGGGGAGMFNSPGLDGI